MSILMISLDKEILDPQSSVANRMMSYGNAEELFILIPDRKKTAFDLSGRVHVQSTGGGKALQFFSLLRIGAELMRKNKIKELSAQDPFFTGLAGYLLKKKYAVPLEVQLHGDFFDSDYYKKNYFLRYILARFIVKRADRLRVVGERIKQSLSKLGLDENKVKIRPIEQTVNLAKIYGRAAEDSDLKKTFGDYEKIFVWAGRMEPIKNLFFLLDVFFEIVKHNPKYGLFLVGKGSQKQALENRVEALDLKRHVRFLGWQYSPAVYLRNADAVLFPSLAEGYGLVPMEAHALGTPVIMSDVGVAHYELKPSETVRIVPVNDKNAFIKAILSL
ncbi:MAG: glycosyltransferase [Candidatus Magasanikbacteria bacterium]|nr:glycosyltransferase [Candidatus Magasanikbacteria bacterium]